MPALPSCLPCARRKKLVPYKASWLLLTHNSLLIHLELGKGVPLYSNPLLDWTGLSLPPCSFKEVPSHWQDSLPSFLLASCQTLLPCSTHPPCSTFLPFLFPKRLSHGNNEHCFRYTMAGLALFAGVLHTNIRPVAEKHFVDNKVNL